LFLEYREVIAQLKHLAVKGEQRPVAVPKLIDMNEAAAMLGISLAHFKNQERSFPFKRKMIGTSVRYRNTDIVKYILTDEDQQQP